MVPSNAGDKAHNPARASRQLCRVAEGEAETERFGAALARALEPGQVISLIGHLGAGKTRLVRAVAAAAGVDSRDITSPTFVLVQEYAGRWPIYHFDAYRLTGGDQFSDLGIQEYFGSAGVSFVEWGDRVAELLPDDHLRIEIVSPSSTSREFRCLATGPRSQRLLERLAQGD
ncbi:MAG: tRNA (adenosine(37)-N6)-threonylcarbamoyltransferase complex ATPase subunit type 1 TsaE [Planctomycetales bacterium]